MKRSKTKTTPTNIKKTKQNKKVEIKSNNNYLFNNNNKINKYIN
jgi:hypothetical protein